MEHDRRGSDLLHRAAVEYFMGGRTNESVQSEPSAQHIPINVFETDDSFVVVAPMPGIATSDVDIELLGDTLTLRAALRGPGQAHRRYLVHEWTYGPYERTVKLPTAVNSERAHATHDNGMLVVTLPKTSHGQPIRVPLGAPPGAGS